MMAKATANSNFSSLGGDSVHGVRDHRYQEYRRCWEENPAHFIVRDFPLHLDLETTNRCNLRCTFCDRRPLLTKEQIGDLDFALYRKILDECQGRLWGLKLSYRGEPLLHPDLTAMVAYAKSKGVLDVYFNTNGMLLTEAASLGLMDAGLDRISVSVEGTDPVAFERQRRGAKFSRILANLDTLISWRTKKGYDRPRIRVQTVKFAGLDLETYKNFWLSHADEVAAVSYQDTRERREGLVCREWACPQLWQRLTMEWTGAMMACNNDDHRLLYLGNLNERSVASCWHDPQVQQARQLHQQGQSHLVRACNGCAWRTAQIQKLTLVQTGLLEL
jgi:radical SAM protein with 4Fe4S-binding SPASM domain